jgi:hypothetical protein
MDPSILWEITHFKCRECFQLRISWQKHFKGENKCSFVQYRRMDYKVILRAVSSVTRKRVQSDSVAPAAVWGSGTRTKMSPSVVVFESAYQKSLPTFQKPNKNRDHPRQQQTNGRARQPCQLEKLDGARPGSRHLPSKMAASDTSVFTACSKTSHLALVVCSFSFDREREGCGT